MLTEDERQQEREHEFFEKLDGMLESLIVITAELRALNNKIANAQIHREPLNLDAMMGSRVAGFRERKISTEALPCGCDRGANWCCGEHAGEWKDGCLTRYLSPQDFANWQHRVGLDR